MSSVFSPPNTHCKVVGVGGAGCQMVSRMAGGQIPSPSAVEYIAMDTDVQSLAMADVPRRIQLGGRLLHGLGSGNDPDMGRRAAEESCGIIRQTTVGSNIFFIVAAMGGGTGAGSSPVIAEMGYRMGALTIGMAATPFAFEGTHRTETARQGVASLLGSVDSLIVMPQDLIAYSFDGRPDVGAVFKTVADLMAKGVQMLTEAIYSPGLINLDFADVRAILKDSGLTEMSFGCASGEDRAAQAAYATLANLSSDVAGRKAKAALFTVAGNSGLTLCEVNSAADVIKHEIDPDANISFAVNCEEKMGEEMKVSLIVTGFAGAENSRLRGDGK